MWIHAQYMPNTYQNTCQYISSGWNPVPKFDTCHYIPNTCQCMPIHTTIHTQYIPILDWCSIQVFAPRAEDSYWHVFRYVLVCIMQVFSMYYEIIPVNCTQYQQLYQYTPQHAIQVNPHNADQYMQKQTNSHYCIQSIPIHTNIDIDQYISICLIHTICTIHTNTTADAYQYLHISNVSTYQYIPILAKHTKNNTYQYILQYIPWQYMPIHSTMQTTIHNYTCHEIQYLPIHT